MEEKSQQKCDIRNKKKGAVFYVFFLPSFSNIRCGRQYSFLPAARRANSARAEAVDMRSVLLFFFSFFSFSALGGTVVCTSPHFYFRHEQQGGGFNNW